MERYKNIFFVVFLGVTLLTFPFVAFACPTFGPTGLACPILPCTGFGTGAFSSLGGGTPCVNLCQLVELVQRTAYFGLNLVLFVLAPIFLGWGALMIIIGRSSLEEVGGSKVSISRGKGIVTSAVVGVVIALGSFLILNTFFFVLGLSSGIAGGSSWAVLVCNV